MTRIRFYFTLLAVLAGTRAHAGVPVMAAYWSGLEKPSVTIARTYPPGVLPGVINKLILTHSPFDDLAKVEASPEWKANLVEYRQLRTKGVAIWVMLANAAAPQYFDAAKGPEAIRRLVAFCERNDIDGIDVDFEGPPVVGDKRYNPFVVALADALHAKGKKVSVASAEYTLKLVSDATLAKIDYILPMAYDETGPWRPNKPGQHASYEFAQRNIANLKKRRVPTSKILLGMPTYGYAFHTGKDGKPACHDFGWSQLLAKYPDRKNDDSAGPGPKTAEGVWYYNGLKTVREKIALANKEHLAGIGVWHGNFESKDPAASFWLTVKDANR